MSRQMFHAYLLPLEAALAASPSTVRPTRITAWVAARANERRGDPWPEQNLRPMSDSVHRAASKAEQLLRRWHTAHHGTASAPRLTVHLVRELAKLPHPGFLRTKTKSQGKRKGKGKGKGSKAGPASPDPTAPLFSTFTFTVPPPPPLAPALPATQPGAQASAQPVVPGSPLGEGGLSQAAAKRSEAAARPVEQSTPTPPGLSPPQAGAGTIVGAGGTGGGPPEPAPAVVETGGDGPVPATTPAQSGKDATAQSEEVQQPQGAAAAADDAGDGAVGGSAGSATPAAAGTVITANTADATPATPATAAATPAADPSASPAAAATTTAATPAAPAGAGGHPQEAPTGGSAGGDAGTEGGRRGSAGGAPGACAASGAAAAAVAAAAAAGAAAAGAAAGGAGEGDDDPMDTSPMPAAVNSSGQAPHLQPQPGSGYSSRERACKRAKSESAPSSLPGPRIIFAASGAHTESALPPGLSWEGVQPLLQLAMSERESRAAGEEPPDIGAYFAHHYEKMRGEACPEAVPTMPKPASAARVEHVVTGEGGEEGREMEVVLSTLLTL